MSAHLPLRPPSALQYFASLVADDGSLNLLEAAASIAQDAEPRLDVQQVLAEVDALALTLRRRLPADAAALHKLRALNQYFHQELGFAGNVNDYYAASNSYIHQVLRTRRGIPISLSVIYLELAQQLGLRACGVSFPGHFLIKLQLAQGDVILDPFSGQSLSRDALEGYLQPYRERAGIDDPQELPLALFLQNASPRQVLARMLRNLKEIHRSAEHWAALLAVQHRLLLLLPEEFEELRDRAAAFEALGQHAAAAADYADYLQRRPEVADAALLQEKIAWLRSQGGAALH
ncbi:transglutaminase-like domain-containing protein [Paucibacter sp. APW11]|uniref:Transglutaminase-like domain-containing protein n=1 Tax=Roseateles aquae TaxID=3077235 RepID=A0ABU3P920_9BURK|nr:transglutaminase-like domain-containing protein [Paucibacter sp. APW11]MDT8998246.1 transglutaminase-like domain-containing protein [Paucibacter sp. APW11]